MSSPIGPRTLKPHLQAFLREWGMPIAELAVRLSAVILSTTLLLRIPLPLVGTPLTLVQALIAFAAVSLVGISVYETLFYNRFRP